MGSAPPPPGAGQRDPGAEPGPRSPRAPGKPEETGQARGVHDTSERRARERWDRDTSVNATGRAAEELQDRARRVPS